MGEVTAAGRPAGSRARKVLGVATGNAGLWRILPFVLLVTSASSGAVIAQVEQNPGADPSDIAELKKLSLVELMDVEVTTVARQDSTVGESPAAIFVITAEDIRRSGATTIPELFRMVPGMSVARIDGNKWAVGVRGFNARFQDKLLVQVDGRTVYNPLFSGVYWDTVDYVLQDIERIEIIRGPGASVWGANAVNGVINIITRSAEQTQGGLIEGGGGSEERGFGTLRYGGTIGRDLAYRVYAKGFDRTEQFASGVDPHDGWWGASTGARADWHAGAHDSVMFDGAYLRSVAGRNDQRATPTAPYVFTNIEDETTDSGHILAHWKHRFAGGSRFSLQAYWDYFDRDSENGIIHFRWDTFDLDFHHEIELGGWHKAVYGFGYRYIDAALGSSSGDGGFATSYPPGHRRPHLISGFVQDQMMLVQDHLSLTLGAKFEHNDHTGIEVQPTGRLLLTPTKRQSIWAAVSRAVRTPNLSEDSVGASLLPISLPQPQFPPGSVGFPRLRGDTDLESEKVLAYEIGYRIQATDWLSIDVALFYNDYDKLRVTRPGAPEPGPEAGTFILPQVFGNGMDGETYGSELSTILQPAAWWQVHAAYSFLDIDLHRDRGLGAAAEAPEGQSPQQQVYLRSSFDLPHAVELDLIGRFVDQLSGFNPGGAAGVSDTVDAYMSFDARLSWAPAADWELTVVGQNLLEDEHPEFGTSAVIRAPLVEVQRAVYGKVAWRF